MTIDISAYASLTEEAYTAMILREHGEVGVRALRSLLAAIRRVLEVVEPEELTERLVIFRTLDDSPSIDGKALDTIDSLDGLQERLASVSGLQVLGSGRLIAWAALDDSSLTKLAERGIVYIHSKGEDIFIAKAERRSAPRLMSGMTSAFANPTFTSLKKALEIYRDRMARNSSCKILDEVWETSHRLVYSNKPEHRMRDSLKQFLSSRLDGAEVRPEQNVDESHPVDIKVTWLFMNRIGLIEIKWLGDSRSSTGNLTSYRDSRANDGAQQLADYLEKNKQQAPTHRTRGYLVLFDARRQGTGSDGRTIPSVADATAYRNLEVTYAPSFHTIRKDFAPPIRFYLEPNVVAP